MNVPSVGPQGYGAAPVAVAQSSAPVAGPEYAAEAPAQPSPAQQQAMAMANQYKVAVIDSWPAEQKAGLLGVRQMIQERPGDYDAVINALAMEAS